MNNTTNTMVVEMAGFDSKGIWRNVGEVVTIANLATVDINSIVLPGFDSSVRKGRKAGR